MAGVKETLELLEGAKALIVEVKKLLGDGFQWSDVEQAFADYEKDPAFKSKIDAALDNVKAVQPELADLDIFEMISLGRSLIALGAIFK